MNGRWQTIAFGMAAMASLWSVAVAHGIPERTGEPAGKFRDTPRAVWNVTDRWELLPVRSSCSVTLVVAKASNGRCSTPSPPVGGVCEKRELAPCFAGLPFSTG
jgi:hypothetical protein